MTKAKRVGADLTSGSLFKVLVFFAGPIILANIIQQVYSLVDLMVIGHFMGSTGTVGVSTGGEMADILTPVATSFGAAGQIYIGQLIGAGDEKQTKAAMGTLISLMMFMSVAFAAVIILFRHPILTMINCPQEAYGQAVNYLVLTTVGFPFIFGYNAVTGILRGMGESRRPLYFIIIAAVSNIFLDIILVGPFHMEAAGTAIATTIAQGASFASSVVYMYRHREELGIELNLGSFKIQGHALKILMGLGLPQAARSVLVRASMLYVNANVNAYGLTESATNSVGNKLQKFLEVFSMSFSQAASAVVAQNLGAKKHDRARQSVLVSCGICLVVWVVTAVLLIFAPKQVFGVFTKDPSVLELGVIYLRIMIIHTFLSAITSTFQAMVIGCGNAALNFVIGILDGVVFKVGLSLIFVRVFDMGVFGYFWGTGLSRLVPAIIVVWYFYSNRWAKRELLA